MGHVQFLAILLLLIIGVTSIVHRKDAKTQSSSSKFSSWNTDRNLSRNADFKFNWTEFDSEKFNKEFEGVLKPVANIVGMILGIVIGTIVLSILGVIACCCGIPACVCAGPAAESSRGRGGGALHHPTADRSTVFYPVQGQCEAYPAKTQPARAIPMPPTSPYPQN